MKFIGTEEYDDFDRSGTSCYVTYLRIGAGRWRIEANWAGIYVRMGAVEFTAGFNWADE